MRNDLQLTPWIISQKGPGWVDEFCESIFFIGNGRMGIRGYVSSEPAHRPIQKGVYLAGIFGEIKPGITEYICFIIVKIKRCILFLFIIIIIIIISLRLC